MSKSIVGETEAGCGASKKSAHPIRIKAILKYYTVTVDDLVPER